MEKSKWLNGKVCGKTVWLDSKWNRAHGASASHLAVGVSIVISDADDSVVVVNMLALIDFKSQCEML